MKTFFLILFAAITGVSAAHYAEVSKAPLPDLAALISRFMAKQQTEAAAVPAATASAELAPTPQVQYNAPATRATAFPAGGSAVFYTRVPDAALRPQTVIVQQSAPTARASSGGVMRYSVAKPATFARPIANPTVPSAPKKSTIRNVAPFGVTEQ